MDGEAKTIWNRWDSVGASLHDKFIQAIFYSILHMLRHVFLFIIFSSVFYLVEL